MITLDEQIAEAQRELALREQCYPGVGQKRPPQHGRGVSPARGHAGDRENVAAAGGGAAAALAVQPAHTLGGRPLCPVERSDSQTAAARLSVAHASGSHCGAVWCATFLRLWRVSSSAMRRWIQARVMRVVCVDHALHVEPDTDYCPQHATPLPA